MSTVLETPVFAGGHNHKPNFGRYVADCARCAEKYPNGPPDRKMIRRHVPTAAEKREALEAEIRAKVFAEIAASRIDEQVSAEMKFQQDSVAAEAPVAVAAATAGITQEQLVEAMRALGAELRRGDPEVERQREEAKLRTQSAKENERKLVMERIAMIEFEQANCSHKMENGLSRIRGQEHGDGLLHEFCTWCQKAFPPRQISAQERAARMA